MRGRSSGGGGDKEEERFGPLGLKGLQLQTPMNPKNRHWDVGDLDLEASTETEPIAEEDGQEDDDEIEYMPPKVEVPYQPPVDFETPNYKELGAKLREMAHSYKYQEDPVLDDFDYVFDISQAELELLNPVDPVPLSDEGGDNPFLESTTSKSKLQSASGTTKSSVATSRIPTTRLPVKASSQKPAVPKTRPTIPSTSRTKTTLTAKPSQSAAAVRTTTTATRPSTAVRSTIGTKPALTARPVKSSATTKAISPRKQLASRVVTSRVQPMKPLVPLQKTNTTTGSSSTTRIGLPTRPPSSASTRKAGTTTSTLAGKKPTGATSKEEDELVLKFDTQEEVEDFLLEV